MFVTLVTFVMFVTLVTLARVDALMMAFGSARIEVDETTLFAYLHLYRYAFDAPNNLV